MTCQPKRMTYALHWRSFHCARSFIKTSGSPKRAPPLLEGSGDRESDRKRLGRMHDVIHDAVLTHRCRRDLGRVAEIVQAVGLDQRTVGVGDLIGPGVEQIEHIELNPPAIVSPVAYTPIEEAGRLRAEGIVFGERARRQITPAER